MPARGYKNVTKHHLKLAELPLLLEYIDMQNFRFLPLSLIMDLL